ncbi:PQQ-binding-like beta-propeller repeat protein [Actinoplanes sp. NPDC051411]|uniref:outer membrane protein assembly factor BamB family protein n=1 Tax=Actinoplanes sp. NPDC051411 TaxID=3155522 RepID=UPI0034263F09
MTSALIDLDTAPAAGLRPGRSRPRGRSALAVLSLVLLALAGPATPPVPEHLKATLITARNEDNVFVSGGKLYVVDAAPTGLPRPMRTYRLPDGKLLSQAALQIPEAVSGVRAVGDTTLVETTIGGRPAVVALDPASGSRRWWQFGLVRGASAAGGLVLLTDDRDPAEDFDAVDLRTGLYRWGVLAPVGGQLLTAGPAAGTPRWLVSVDPAGRLDSYDALTGKHLATARPAPFGPMPDALAEPAGSLLLIGTDAAGATAYTLPGLATRWHRPTGSFEFAGAWLEPDCGAELCAYLTNLVALDAATGQTRWTSDRWTYAHPAGGYLLAGNANGTPDQMPLTVLDPATGRVRADLGGWRQVLGPDGTMAYAVNAAGHPALFGRFDPARTAVRILGTTDADFGHCDAAAGAVVCHLTDGPVAIWRPGV